MATTHGALVMELSSEAIYGKVDINDGERAHFAHVNVASASSSGQQKQTSPK